MSAKVKPKLIAALLISVVCALLLIRYPYQTLHHGAAVPGDFGVYFRAWIRARAGQSPYVLSDLSPFKYAPGVLGWMSLLPQDSSGSWAAFSSVSILLLSLALWNGARFSNWKSVLLLLLGLALSWKGILETLDYGQLEVFIFGIAMLACTLRRRSPAISGLLSGMLPWFKLPWILLFFPLSLVPAESFSEPGVKVRRTRLFISGYLFSSFIWGAAVPIVTFGTERAKLWSRDWLELLHAQPKALYISDMNQSLWVSGYRWISYFKPSDELGIGLAAGIGLILSGWMLGRLALRTTQAQISREPLAWFTPWMLLTQLLNPLSWRWGSALAVGAAFSASNSTFKTKPLWKVFCGLVFLLWALQQNPVIKLLGFQHWSQLHGLGLISLFWLVLIVVSL